MKYELNLHLFDGGEGGGAPGTSPAGGTAPAVQAGARNPLANVRYGKQAAAEADAPASVQEPETHVTSDTAEQKRTAFEELIKGEYKAEFDARAQQIIDARFKQTKEMEARQAAMQPVLDALCSKYGVDAADVDKLRAAIEEDDSYYAEEAERKGLTVEQLKEFKRLERENAAFQATLEERQRREQADGIYARWQQESDQLSQVYPGFDLSAECQSPETGRNFLRLLQNGVDVRTAYEVIHKDELLSGAIGYAVQTAQKRTMDNIRARGMRPQENGAGGSVAAQLVKPDPSKWTKADRREVARRVLRGERIELN